MESYNQSKEAGPTCFLLTRTPSPGEFNADKVASREIETTGFDPDNAFLCTKEHPKSPLHCSCRRRVHALPPALFNFVLGGKTRSGHFSFLLDQEIRDMTASRGPFT